LTNGKIILIISLVKKLFFFIQGLFTYPFLAVPAFAEAKVNPCEGTPEGIAKALCDLGGTDGANVAKQYRILLFFS
jgi:hypothetical protein